MTTDVSFYGLLEGKNNRSETIDENDWQSLNRLVDMIHIDKETEQKNWHKSEISNSPREISKEVYNDSNEDGNISKNYLKNERPYFVYTQNAIPKKLSSGFAPSITNSSNECLVESTKLKESSKENIIPSIIPKPPLVKSKISLSGSDFANHLMQRKSINIVDPENSKSSSIHSYKENLVTSKRKSILKAQLIFADTDNYERKLSHIVSFLPIFIKQDKLSILPILPLKAFQFMIGQYHAEIATQQSTSAIVQSGLLQHRHKSLTLYSFCKADLEILQDNFSSWDIIGCLSDISEIAILDEMDSEGVAVKTKDANSKKENKKLAGFFILLTDLKYQCNIRFFISSGHIGQSRHPDTSITFQGLTTLQAQLRALAAGSIVSIRSPFTLLESLTKNILKEDMMHIFPFTLKIDDCTNLSLSENIISVLGHPPDNLFGYCKDNQCNSKKSKISKASFPVTSKIETSGCPIALDLTKTSLCSIHLESYLEKQLTSKRPELSYEFSNRLSDFPVSSGIAPEGKTSDLLQSSITPSGIFLKYSKFVIPYDSGNIILEIKDRNGNAPALLTLRSIKNSLDRSGRSKGRPLTSAKNENEIQLRKVVYQQLLSNGGPLYQPTIPNIATSPDLSKNFVFLKPEALRPSSLSSSAISKMGGFDPSRDRKRAYDKILHKLPKPFLGRRDECVNKPSHSDEDLIDLDISI